jgi:hypothetical protein
MTQSLTLPVALQRMMDAWSAFDEAGYVAAFAEGARSIDPTGVAASPEEFAQHVRISAANWSSMQITVDDLIVDGDRVAYAYTATMVGKAGGWEGKTVVLPCVAFVRIAGDRILEFKETFDTGILRRARTR